MSHSKLSLKIQKKNRRNPLLLNNHLNKRSNSHKRKRKLQDPPQHNLSSNHRSFLKWPLPLKILQWLGILPLYSDHPSEHRKFVVCPHQDCQAKPQPLDCQFPKINQPHNSHLNRLLLTQQIILIQWQEINSSSNNRLKRKKIRMRKKMKRKKRRTTMEKREKRKKMKISSRQTTKMSPNHLPKATLRCDY